MSKRVDSFDGTSEEYTSYLEKELLTARHELRLRDNDHTAKRKRTSEPQWKTCAKRLIAGTPKAETWTSALKENGIHDIMKNGDAIQCLLDSKFEPRQSAHVAASGAGDIHENDDHIIVFLETYARTTAMRWTLASTALALANFQKLLVISACAVLMEGSTPIAKVYDIVRICIGKDSTNDHCKRTITTARYLNVLIDTLNIHQWGHRAGELLLIWNQAPSYYYHLSCSRKDSLDYLRTQLCLNEFAAAPEENPDWTPIFIPGLVYHILGQKTSIERVSHVLGYQKAEMLGTRINPWDAFPDTST